MPSPTALRPFTSKTHAVYLPILVKDAIMENVIKSNRLFFLSPTTLCTLVAISFGLLYQLSRVFVNTLQLPGEDIVNQAGWQDKFSLFIYAVPPIAILVLSFWLVANWVHTKIWTRVAETEIRRIDLLDTEEYYTKGHSSGFWCLEYEDEIVSCFGIDARNPGRLLSLFEKAELPKIVEQIDKKPDRDDVDEDARDMALFRHAVTNEPNATGNGTRPAHASIALPEKGFTTLDYDPLPDGHLLPKSLQEEPHLAEIRHLSISPSYNVQPGVSSRILNLAVRSAFASSSQINKLVLTVNAKLDGPLKNAALQQGFHEAGKSPSLFEVSQPKESAQFEILGQILRHVWPIAFTRDVLLLERSAWQKTTTP